MRLHRKICISLKRWCLLGLQINKFIEQQKTSVIKWYLDFEVINFEIEQIVVETDKHAERDMARVIFLIKIFYSTNQNIWKMEVNNML